jgi:hypothetical protein
MNCPLVLIGEGAHFTRKWAVITDKDLGFYLGGLKGTTARLYCGDSLVASLDNGFLSIRPSYACDGYSPVKWSSLLNKWLRFTPIPYCGLAPAILHDLTRQYLGVEGCPWTREQTDTWFRECMIAGGTSPLVAWIYYKAVSSAIGTAYMAGYKPANSLKIVRFSA